MSPGHEHGRPAIGEDWRPLEDAIKRFVDAWRRGAGPAIDDYLPAGGDLRHLLLVELAHTDLELRLKAGEAARVEEYLARYPELAGDRAAALDLIAAEYELRRRGEPRLSLDEYLQRFPRYRGELPEQIARATAVGSDADGDTPPLQAAPLPEDPPEVAGYEVLGPLGRGGMGVVYKARQKSLDRLVALKFLPEECARDSQWLGRFRGEALTASALNHPHICTIYDTGECAGRPFLSMELVEGRTLEALVGRRLPVEELARLVGQAAKALRTAHAAGVVHRDLKPANLMVRDDGIVKVLDFGLAHRLPAGGPQGPAARSGGTDPGTRVGTVLYMAPEQARAEPVSGATDIFALGVVLYELATGRHPFLADAEVSVLHAIVTQAPPPPSRLNPEVPAALEALIQRMLAKDPRLRPTAAEVDAALTELAGSGSDRPGNPPPCPGKRPTVGRQHELAALRAGFESAAAGRGLMLCVTGESGLGKTTLVEDFLDGLAAGGRPHAVARGRCSERLAGTEAYLPVLEALDSLLQGEGGAAAAQMMKLLAPTWFVQVAPLAAHEPSLARVLAEAKEASQERRKRELGVFLHEVARLRPLVVFLDDVHWADPSSVDLLAYLGGKCAGLPLLLVLTYRPSDLLLGQHPFGPVKLDLQGRGVCREVALPFLSRADLDRYLALAFAGHQFPEEFAAAIHAKTEGNPLFMVDVLRYLRDRGVLVQDQDRWALAQAVPDLERELPQSVRSMIQRKTDQLGEEDRRLLMAASVQGTEFDSAVVAQTLGLEAAAVEERLDVLERVHALVRLVREREFPDRTLTLRYGFVHVLYQNALYASLRPTRKAAWSAAAAQALLGHYGENSAAVATELALLFQAAREHARAADFFLLAAQHAAEVHAHREAVALARRGLELVRELPDTPERGRRELRLQVTLGMQLQVTQGFAAPEVEQTYTRARKLCHRLKDDAPLFGVLWGLWLFHKVRSELAEARGLAEQLFTLAGRLRDPALVLQSHQAHAVTSLCLGDPAATRGHMERGTALYDPLQHRGHTFLYGQDPGVACLAFGAVALWLLGYPDQAARKSQEAVDLGRELGQPSTLVLALHFAAMLRQLCRDGPATRQYAEATAEIAAEQGFSFWHAGGTVLRGWALAEGGDAGGIDLLRQGLAAWLATGSVTYQTYYLALLAEVLAKHGKLGEGWRVLDEALAVAARTSEGLFEAELHRLRGEFLRRGAGASPGAAVGSVPDEAGACFRRALAVARRQGAKSLELRAAMSLARLLRGRGRPAEGRELLAEAYGWFTEGFDNRDLQEARALLEEVSA